MAKFWFIFNGSEVIFLAYRHDFRLIDLIQRCLWYQIVLKDDSKHIPTHPKQYVSEFLTLWPPFALKTTFLCQKMTFLVSFQ